MKLPCLLLLALVCAWSPASRAASGAEDGLRFYSGSSEAPFSRAVRSGRMLYLSGEIGVRPDGMLPPDFDEQSVQLMENIRATLADFGVGMERVVKCTVFIADMGQWSRFNAIYTRYFAPGRMPARSAVGANGLALGAALEMECIADMAERTP